VPHPLPKPHEFNCVQDFIALDRAVPASEVDYGYLKFPLAGNGLAMAYNLPQLNSTDPTLVSPPFLHQVFFINFY
jgi:hypothetical protein